jgi:hypothetical protein
MTDEIGVDKANRELWKERDAAEEVAVSQLGRSVGFGRIMQLCQKLWREHLIEQGYPAGGEFVYGPCAVFMVECPHPVKDENGHCEICCGSGQITKGTAKLAAHSAALKSSLCDILSRFKSCIAQGNGEIEGDKETIAEAEKLLA